MGLFFKSCLGIDIGTFSIKIVELTQIGRKRKLGNYIQFQNTFQTTSPFRSFGKDSPILLSEEVAEVLEALIKKTKIKEKRAFIAIPDFSTFFTTFSLPPMTESEIPQAVEFEARHHIPIPLSDVTFDWQAIETKEEMKGVKKLKILLVAVPNSVINQYQRIATLAGLKLEGLEAEIFGLVRASIWGKKNQKTLCLVDIGYTSATISIIDNGILKESYSVDMSSLELTKALVDSLKIEFSEAEKLKETYGLDPKKFPVFQVLSKQINLFCLEIQRICENFYQNENKQITNIILAGGTAFLPGLKEYFKAFLKKEIEISNPFLNISAPQFLKERLKELGPSFSIALGMALRGVEE